MDSKVQNAAIERAAEVWKDWKAGIEKIACQAQTISDFKAGYQLAQQEIESNIRMIRAELEDKYESKFETLEQEIKNKKDLLIWLKEHFTLILNNDDYANLAITKLETNL